MGVSGPDKPPDPTGPTGPTVKATPADPAESKREVIGEVPVVGARSRRSGLDLSLDSDASPTQPAHWGWKVAVTVSLLAGALTALVFPMVSGWLFGVGMTTMFGGEILSRTDGLDLQVFEVGYYVSLWLNVGLVGWSAVRRFTRKEHPWRPLFWGTLIQTVVFGVFATLDAQGHMDAPDGLTTTATLGVIWLWTYVLPLFMLAVLWRLAVVLWRVGASSSADARRVVAGSSLAVLGATFLIGLPSMPGETLTIDDNVRAQIFRAPPGDAGGERKVYLGVARQISSTQEDEREARRSASNPFNQCMETLGLSEGGVSPVEMAVRNLASQLRLADAQDLAYSTLLDVCLQHSKAAILSLREYFWKALHNARGRFCKKASRRVTWSNETIDLEFCQTLPSSPESRTFWRALEALSTKERQAIQMAFYEGRDHGEIAEALGISVESSRALRSNAMRKLRRELGIEERESRQ